MRKFTGFAHGNLQLQGSRIEWSAAGNPVRFTDTSGKVVGKKKTQTVAAR